MLWNNNIRSSCHCKISFCVLSYKDISCCYYSCQIFCKLIYESDERKKQWAERENMYITSYTKFVEITTYPWLDYVLYVML